MSNDIYWLNKDSRKFLERGYLLEGESPEQRIKSISDSAERYLGIEGFSNKFYDYMAKGFFSLSSPIWSNFGRDRGMPISCVIGDTWINTKIGGGKLAREVEIGDEVLTHKGRYRKVTDIILTKNRSNIYELKVANRMTPIFLTENHLVLTNLGWIRTDELNPNIHFVAINGDVDSIERDYTIDMKSFCVKYKPYIVDGKICKKIAESTKINSTKNGDYVEYIAKPYEFVDIDNELAWAFGFWFAEGSVSVDKNRIPNGIRITFNDKDERVVGESWFEIIKKKFNIDGNIYRSEVVRNGKTNSWLTCNVNSHIIGNLFKSFGDNCKTKLIPEWIINLPKEKLQYFLDGILIGDGSRKRNNLVSITVANPKMLLQIYQIGLKLGHEMSLQMQTKAGKLSTTKYVYNCSFRKYKMGINKNLPNCGIKFNDGLIYVPIKTLQLTSKVEDVFDFTVEEDHSFSAAGVILHNCFGSYIPDTMYDILHKLSEVGMMTKAGGGTSAYFGDLRPRGATINSGGTSTGSVHFMELYEKLMSVVSQGNVRRGSFAAYLPVEHPDIEEFLKIKSEGNKIQDISIGVCITDEWMKSMLGGDKPKRKIWGDIIKKRFESGYPYIFFTDNVNNQAPQVYKDRGMKIHHSNLCVTGDQRVVSSLGLLTAKELFEIGSNIDLFDNSEIVKSSPIRLVEKNADVYKITLENGMSHTITSYHKIVVKDKISQKKETYQEVLTKNMECKDLKIGDSVAIQTQKGLFGKTHKPKEAFLLGLYQADGTQHKDYIMLDIWENDFDLIDEIQSYHDCVCDEYNTQLSKFNRKYNNPKFSDCSVAEGSDAKKRLTSKALKKALNFEKGYVPDWIWEANEETQWQYIRGLYYADGTVFKSTSSGEPIQIALASINKEFLSEIQLILANLGMQSSIRILRKAGQNLLPDGKGGKKYYETKDCYRLIIGNKNDALVFNEYTSFLDRKNIFIDDKEYRDNTKKFYKINSIEYVGKEDVYCVTVESDKHHWICNGFITHNCSEIMLPDSKKESFVCDLSSLNLEKWDEWKDTDAVETLVYFLDAVMTEFIEKTVDDEFMKAPRLFAINHRALGVGVLGWHSLLQKKMISFESMDAKFLNSSIWQTIRSKSDKASTELAVLFGEPEILKGYGRRNATTLAIAPTTSSSFILGQVSPSIEPLNSNYYVRDLAKGKFSYRNPYLKSLLIDKNKDTDDVWRDILIHGGSVQHLDFLSQEERNVFKTFGEISQKEIVIQAAQRQKYIDQGQSLNFMIPPNTKPKEVNELMVFAWEMGIKSLYYQRSANPAQELARSIITCHSCQA